MFWTFCLAVPLNGCNWLQRKNRGFGPSKIRLVISKFEETFENLYFALSNVEPVVIAR